MAAQDDDNEARIPDPDTEPSPAELARARRFAELVDNTLSGRTPPAMSADDRALLEVATVIRATHGQVELEASKQRAAVEDALRQAIGAPSAGRGQVTLHEPHAPQTTPIAGGRARMRRRAPWIVAGTTTLVAAAAIAMLWLRTPAGAGHDHPVAGRAEVPEEWTSRPADALVGPIARDHAGDARARIDAIFADRLDGFRTRRLARGGKP